MPERNPIRNESGLFILAATTLVLTALIGGATLLSIIATRKPISGAMERLDRNQATPEDMQTLQDANKDMERSMRIARGGASFIGGGGPVPNPAAPGTFFPGEKTLVGRIPAVISRLTVQASEPTPTRNNPLPRDVASTPYDPRKDPQYGKPSEPPVAPGDIPGVSTQEVRPGESGGAIGGGSPLPIPGAQGPARGSAPGSDPLPLPPLDEGFRPPRYPEYLPPPMKGPGKAGEPSPCPPGTHRKPGDPTGPCHRN